MPSINDPTQVVVGLDVRLFLADVNDDPDFPTSETDDVIESAPWYETGYITPDGVVYQDNFTQETIRAIQAVAPIRVVSTARDPQLTVAAMQWNTQNLITAFGGGSVDTPGHYIGPKTSDAPVERSACLDLIDGDKILRFVFRRAGLSQGSSFNIVRNASSNLAMVLAVLDPGGDTEFVEMHTNLDSIVPLASS